MSRSGFHQAAPGSPALEPDPNTGRLVGRATIRVRYAETDRMGVAYNAHYLTWFEIGRTEFMRGAGIPYRTIEERGYNLPLTAATLRLPLAVRYDDVLRVETQIEQVRSRAVTFDYRVLLEQRVAAHGLTVHACVRAADGRTVNFPPWLMSRLQELAASGA
jgi:acyl-CoA thioester hydrolase